MKSDLSPENLVRWKNELRHQALARLRACSAAALKARSHLMVELAGDLPELRTAACCAYFVPLPLEPAIRPLVELAWRRSQRVALPRRALSGNGRPETLWCEVQGWQQLSSLPHERLLEPDPGQCRLINPTDLGCMLVPGLAFDSQGNRLGRGGGFYDAALAKLSSATETIGLMFADQQLPHLPAGPLDRPLRAVLTEAGFTRFGPGLCPIT